MGIVILAIMAWLGVNLAALALFGPILRPRLTQKQFALVGALIGGVTGGLCSAAIGLLTS
jgi:hypothetical protein